MKHETSTLFLLGVAHSLNHSLFLVLAPLLSNIALSLNASFQQLGLVASITFFIYGAGALLGGPFSDMMGSVRIAQISLGLAGLSSLLFLVCQDLMVFSIAMWLMALWASFYHPTVNGLIAKAFPEKTGNAMGIHNAAGNLGQVLTPSIAYSIGFLYSWRLSFVTFGVLSIITSLLLSKIKLINESRKIEFKISLRELIMVPYFWQFLLFNLIIGFIFRGVEVFFPSFLIISRGFLGEHAALASSLILLSGTLGQIIGGRGSDKYGGQKIILFSCMGVCLSLFFLLLMPNNIIFVGFFSIMYGVTVFSHQPAITMLVSKIMPINLIGSSYGLLFFFSFGLGSLSAMMIGYISDLLGIEKAFWINAIASVVLVVATLYIRKSLMKNPKIT
ncbi:MFS transporter [Candidatus Bathyarchaeota archaeon]|nr:MFS transporter [Candidatus Bathyarchaeota archaeon]